MATHPKIQARVYEEICELFDPNDEANDDQVKSNELNQLKYMIACLKACFHCF